MSRFNALVRRIHIYLGLLSFTNFLIYGVAGLSATLRTSQERPKQVQATRYATFTPGAMFTDKQVADGIYRMLDLPFTRPMPDWFLRRTPDGHLLLDFYNINGIYRVTVLESENRIKIEEIRNDLWLFLEDMHATVREDGEHFRLIRLWGFYNEFAMWTLLGMTITGVYIWLAYRTRPWRWIRDIHLVLGLFAAPFLLMYGVSAVQMTHNSWFNLKPAVSETEISLEPGIGNARKLTGLLLDRGAVFGELASSEATPAGLKLRITRPDKTWEVSYDRTSGKAKLKTGANGFLLTLNRLHHAAGIWHEHWIYKSWTIFVGLASAALLLLGATGIYLWYIRRPDRAVGLILIGINAAFCITILILIR